MATLNIANPEEFLAQFNEALNAAPSSRLRQIIRDICRLLPPAISIVSDTLLVTEDQVPTQHDSASASGTNSGASAPDDGILEVKPASLKSKKRVRPRYAACANCGEEYDVTENSKESCCFHPEPAVEDEEYWADFDSWDHYDGPIDTEENREDHPEGFVHGCCEKSYGEEGCKVGWHEEESSGRKRRRA